MFYTYLSSFFIFGEVGGDVVLLVDILLVVLLFVVEVLIMGVVGKLTVENDLVLILFILDSDLLPTAVVGPEREFFGGFSLKDWVRNFELPLFSFDWDEEGLSFN